MSEATIEVTVEEEGIPCPGESPVAPDSDSDDDGPIPQFFQMMNSALKKHEEDCFCNSCSGKKIYEFTRDNRLEQRANEDRIAAALERIADAICYAPGGEGADNAKRRFEQTAEDVEAKKQKI
jgi:hypothetical protein